ncbi:hypothetical protein Vretimale_11990 [Volvox reticuliferus]|uniref:Uncharacterized protein n=1 Tax=Volvox reticuliferus TaxID=1737510 RepID=A0A8J4LSN5_9CHLO|nr:hypothetical protein Vretifemale_11492 [Volvox reticuliferus]GIM07997.1 hypothetical protein Vretimale_11990 [Volvox reticuliferus]
MPLVRGFQLFCPTKRGCLGARRATSRSSGVTVYATAKRAVFITGGNTGIGYETAKALAAQGFRVTIGCRDAVKAGLALARIKEAFPSAVLDSVPLDLADLSSVSDCAKRVLDSGVQYDVWINNAGVMSCPKMSTAQGFEYQLGVNHLGHFALTNQVLPALQTSNKPVRIINVASAAHAFGKIDFNDLMLDRSYDAWQSYGRSKLANILFSYELNRRLRPGDNITVNCLHPGIVKTELGRYMAAETTWYMPLAMGLMKLFMLEPAQGAATSIYLASSPEVEGVTGKYFVNCSRAVSSNDSYNHDTARRLWEISQELTMAP